MGKMEKSCSKKLSILKSYFCLALIIKSRNAPINVMSLRGEEWWGFDILPFNIVKIHSQRHE